MAMMPHHSITHASITPPANPNLPTGDPRFLNSSERSLYAAYKRNLDSAQSLATANKHHDAWILLNISVECFFKYIYVLIRPDFEKFASSSPRLPLGPLDYDGIFVFYHPKGRFGDKISLKDFGHEVMNLWQLIWRFTDLNTNLEFNTLKNFIPSQSDWVNARYERANHSNYQTKYTDYHQSFNDSLTNTFGALK